MKFENAYDTVKSDELFNGESAPSAAEINTIAAAEVFIAGEKPDVPVENPDAADVESYEDKFEEIEKELDALYEEAKTEMDMPESFDPGLEVKEPEVEILTFEEEHAEQPAVELVLSDSVEEEKPYEFVLEEPEADPVEHIEAHIELVVPETDPVEHVEADIELVVPETDLF